MALHSELPIYKSGVALLTLALRIQEQMPRSMKRLLGEKIGAHCTDMLNLMALANASQKARRAAYIEELLTHLRAATVLLRVGHECRYISHALWAESVQLLGSIGSQGGGWLKSAHRERGIDFVGHVIQPWRRTTRDRTLFAALERIESMADADVYQAANSYFGLLRQATHSHADRARLGRAVLRRDRCVAGDLTKTFKRGNEA